MELKEILAVAGAPGLYKFIAQGKTGIIVESLIDGKRTMVAGSAKVSALGDIAMFTETEELPLGQIFQDIFDKNAGGQVISPKASPDELKAFFASVVPTYDRDRVHVSDIKKVAAWYNILAAAGMTKFTEEEPAEAAVSEEVAKEEAPAKKAAKPKADKPAAKKPAAAKSAAPKAASKAKVNVVKNTTSRKSS